MMKPCRYDGSLLTGLIAVSTHARSIALSPNDKLLPQMEQFQNVFHSGTTGPKVSVLFSLYTV